MSETNSNGHLNGNGKPKKVGRPSKFHTIDQDLIKFLILKGCTDKEICKVLKINNDTLCEWKNKYPDFSEALKDWKHEADHKVERSLYERALGYRTTYKKNFVVSDGKDNGSHLEVAEEEVVYPPDPTSCIFWLKNRKPSEWREKHEVEHSGSISWEGLVNDFTRAKEKDLSRLQGVTSN